MRLNKFLATAGVASRRKCDELIASGKIFVNNKQIFELGTQVDEINDVVEYNKKQVVLTNEFVYIKLNKPKGFLCATSDSKNRKTIFDIVKIPNVRLFNIGRLDYNTEGLLLLTNDGDFAQHLIHPSFDIEKEYHCTIEGSILESELAVLRAGVVEDGKKMPKAKVEVLEYKKDDNGKVIRTKLSIKIKEGLNRQIRRMFEVINKNIILLKRVAIGDIKLGGLKRGEFKNLTEKEKQCIGSYIL